MKAALVTVNCTLAAAAMAGETAAFFKPSKSAAPFPLREGSAFSPTRILFLMAEPQIDHLDLVLLFFFGCTGQRETSSAESTNASFPRMPFSGWQPISITVGFQCS